MSKDRDDERNTGMPGEETFSLEEILAEFGGGGHHPLSGDAPFPAHGAVSRRAARAGQGGVFPGGPAGGSTPRSAASTGAGGAAGGRGQGVGVPR